MPNSDFQRHSFLGGEVSPSLYERADMDKFGKWFATAENIRFRETGAFRSRSGFVKIANTKFNTEGQIVKLLSFAFNDEEAFMVELGPGYARFYRNGAQIMAGDEPYELATDLTDFTEEDLKYAQAGDTIFITHPKQGIYELARLQADGSNWEWKKFTADIMPMKEENNDKDKTMTLTSFVNEVKTLDLSNPDTSAYLNVSFTFDGSVVYTATSATLSEIYEGIVEAVGTTDYSIVLNGTTLTITPVDAVGTLPGFSISFSTNTIEHREYSVTQSCYFTGSTAAGSITCNPISYNGWGALDSISVKVIRTYRNKTVTIFNGTKILTAASVFDSASLASGYGAFSDQVNVSGNSLFDNAFSSLGRRTTSSNGLDVDLNLSQMTYTMTHDQTSSYRYDATVTLNGHTDFDVTRNYSRSAVTTSSSTSYYTLTSNSGEFANVSVGDCVLVKHAIDQSDLHGNYNTGTHTIGPVRSDGNWRSYNLGNWAGKVQIQYSTDNQATWVDYYSWASEDKNQPYNNSTSGSLVADDLVWFRVVLTVTDGTIRYYFTANSFDVNSYYKVLYKNSANSVVVECVKNDVGLFSNNSQWRLPAFSNHEGWPQTVAFYQNRLFFGKDYIVYGSRSNDFWDFYEPIKLQADDPVTMSLLSQKVNTIRNLVTQRSFFTFTAGGEFGIGSEGALTQNDKYLKPFSANGSAQCNPVLISDKVLFVDKSYNSIRALQYSLEADGYEAPDITITLRALMENEKIISTDIIYEEKEALFLSNTGTVWVLKYITDQNVLSWSHWKHAFGKITNICVVPKGAKHDLYIAVEDNRKKWIELMNPDEHMDTVEYFDATEDSKVTVSGDVGDMKAIIQGDKRYFKYIDENGQIETPDDTTTGFKVGSVYVSTATMLSPVIQLSDYHHANYEVKNPFKVFFYYLNSYGFKVGVEEDEKMGIEWQPINADIDEEIKLTSGKKSVLIPSRFENSAMVSFVQNEPFPMEVADVLIQTDFGGK